MILRAVQRAKIQQADAERREARRLAGQMADATPQRPQFSNSSIRRLGRPRKRFASEPRPLGFTPLDFIVR